MLELDDSTGYLKAGVHEATLEELAAAFGAVNFRRRAIMDGLRWVVERLRNYGVETIWVDGSFLTSKERPGDVDVVYVPPDGADTGTWGYLSFPNRRELKKLKKVDLWPHPSPQRRGLGAIPLIEWFQTDEDGVAKGVLLLIKEEEDSPDDQERSPTVAG